METLQSLQKRIITSGKLQGIVKSMKTLSAVSIRQYERAAASLDRYVETIEAGIGIALKARPLPARLQRAEPVQRGLVIFGSDQGLCGRFNERLAEFVAETIMGWEVPRSALHLLVIGARIGARLEAAGFAVKEQFWVPGSVAGINPGVFQVLLTLEQWQRNHGITHIDLFFNKHTSALRERIIQQPLLPLDNEHMREIAQRPWPGRCVPQYRIAPEQLFSDLLRQFFFVSLFRAQAESLASEQASRLRSLQNAEKNIEEHIEELSGEYRVKRQASITSELLDLVAGYKTVAVLKKSKDQEEGSPQHG